MAVKYTVAHLEKMESATVRPDPNSSREVTVQLPRIAVAEVGASVKVEDGRSALVAVPELEGSTASGNHSPAQG